MAARSDLLPAHAFGPQGGYDLLPFRFARIPGVPGRVLVTSEVGEYEFLSEADLRSFVRGTLVPGSDAHMNLQAKHFLHHGDPSTAIRLLAAKYRTKKSFMRMGPALHVFVVTLRCDHSCLYCQVSRQQSGDRFDMSEETALAAIDRLFESPAPAVTVEFQGGEPLLAFGRLRRIVAAILERNRVQRRSITFAITTTLHHATDEVLAFLREHAFQVSTSLDGPAALHDGNRPSPGRDSHGRTHETIERARAALGIDKVSALTTLTRRSLEQPQAIVDEYVRLGFRSIFLRPLSPYGFAVRSERRIGYTDAEFLGFYERALAHVIELNRRGTAIDEAYTALLLAHILTPFPTGYTDLRSPTGAGLGALVYNYDGGVYASDEGRMLAEMGDHALRLGTVTDPYQELMRSDAMQMLLAAGVAETLPGCSDCAFLAYCGADPVYALARQGDPVGHRPTSGHCRKQTGAFDILFRYLAEADPTVMRIFTAWAAQRPVGTAVRGLEAA